MRRSSLLIALAFATTVVYVALLVVMAVAKSSAPTDAAALRYVRQQVSSFAAEGALLAGQAARGRAWDQYRRGAADILEQQASSLGQQLSGESFTADVASQGRQLTSIAKKVSGLIEQLAAQDVSSAKARRLKVQLERLAQEAGGLK